jgi:selenocysteine lyase/cysteine desulfurase
MGLTRKQLLAGAAAAGVVAGCGGSQKKSAAAALDPGDWASVKAQFALDPEVHHFDAFVLATHPRPVREAIERHRRALDADPAGYLHAREGLLDSAVAEAAANYLGVEPGDLAFTDSTTMGLGLVYGGVEVDGDVVTTEHDFYSTHESLALRFGKVRQIRLYDDPATATVDGIVAAARSGVDDRTGLLALTWVHSGTGVKLPVQAIADAVPPGTLVVADGVHALAAVDEPHGAGVLVAGCHKWLGGPRGTGLVWTTRWDALKPTIPSFHPTDGPSAATFTPGGYHSFEHRWALAEAFAFHSKLGRGRVADRIAALATRLKEGLAELPKVRLATPMAPELSAGIVCFDVDGVDPHGAVDQLRREHNVAASVTPYAIEHVRLGAGIWTDEADVDAAIAAIGRL